MKTKILISLVFVCFSLITNAQKEEEFQTFLVRFTSDSIFRDSRISYPLKVRTFAREQTGSRDTTFVLTQVDWSIFLLPESYEKYLPREGSGKTRAYVKFERSVPPVIQKVQCYAMAADSMGVTYHYRNDSIRYSYFFFPDGGQWFLKKALIDSGKPTPKNQETSDPVFTIAEVWAAPEMGKENYDKYLRDNIKYPSKAKREKISGTVYVSFIVERDGKLNDFKIVKGLGFGCDEEAIRVIKEGPVWTAGKQRGKPVRMVTTLPVVFNRE